MSCILALLNIIHNLKSSGCSPTGDWVEATNQSVIFFSFTLHFHSTILFSPSSSPLRHYLSVHFYQQQTKKDKNKKSHLQEADHIFKGHCQVLIHNLSLQAGNIKARRPPEFAIPVGFSRGGHGIYCAKHLKQYSGIGGWAWHSWLH